MPMDTNSGQKSQSSTGQSTEKRDQTSQPSNRPNQFDDKNRDRQNQNNPQQQNDPRQQKAPGSVNSQSGGSGGQKEKEQENEQRRRAS
jgi:hypothetical protein